MNHIDLSALISVDNEVEAEIENISSKHLDEAYEDFIKHADAGYEAFLSEVPF